MLEQRFLIDAQGLTEAGRGKIAANPQNPGGIADQKTRLALEIFGRLDDLLAIRLAHQVARLDPVRPAHVGILRLPLVRRDFLVVPVTQEHQHGQQPESHAHQRRARQKRRQIPECAHHRLSQHHEARAEHPPCRNLRRRLPRPLLRRDTPAAKRRADLFDHIVDGKQMPGGDDDEGQDGHGPGHTDGGLQRCIRHVAVGEPGQPRATDEAPVVIRRPHDVVGDGAVQVGEESLRPQRLAHFAAVPQNQHALQEIASFRVRGQLSGDTHLGSALEHSGDTRLDGHDLSQHGDQPAHQPPQGDGEDADDGQDRGRNQVDGLQDETPQPREVGADDQREPRHDGDCDHQPEDPRQAGGQRVHWNETQQFAHGCLSVLGSAGRKVSSERPIACGEVLASPGG